MTQISVSLITYCTVDVSTFVPLAKLRHGKGIVRGVGGAGTFPACMRFGLALMRTSRLRRFSRKHKSEGRHCCANEMRRMRTLFLAAAGDGSKHVGVG